MEVVNFRRPGPERPGWFWNPIARLLIAGLVVLALVLLIVAVTGAGDCTQGTLVHSC